MRTKTPAYLQECDCGKVHLCKICRSKYNRVKTLARTDEDRRKAREHAKLMYGLGVYTYKKEK